MTRPSPSSGPDTVTPASISSPRAMSITLYFQNGGPPGATPRRPSQPKTSWFSGGTPAAIWSMGTCTRMATYGSSARVTICGSGICLCSRGFDGQLDFGDPLTGVGVPFEGDLAGVAGRAETVRVHPPGQRLAG